MKPHERLVRARVHARFNSARAAALHHGWPESTYRAHEKGTRNFGLEDAEKYGEAFGISGRWIAYEEGKMELPATYISGTSQPYGTIQKNLPNVGNRRNSDRFSGRRIPVYGQAAEGLNGEFIMSVQAVDDAMCPPGLESVLGAYALYVLGDTMEPRYKAGEIVYINPAKPCRKGDYVVVQIRGEADSPNRGFIKRFEAFTPSTLIISQFNPPQELEFARIDVVSVHRIVFSGEA